jgi:hypothetical protein
MALDMESQVRKILSEKDSSMAHHLWLEGLSIIDNYSVLDPSLINYYTADRIKNYVKFTPLISGCFANAFQPQIAKGIIRSIHLPLTDDAHIELWLESDKCGLEHLFYVNCYHNCRLLPPYRFPQAELKSSLNVEKGSELEQSILSGKFFCDPQLPIKSQTVEMLTETFKTFESFIHYAKKD